MSVIVPKRRLYDGDVVNPEDFNDTLDDINRGLADLNEHNLDGKLTNSFPTQVALTDLADDAAWRVKAVYNDGEDATTAIQKVMDGAPETVTGAVVFRDVEQWHTVWEFTWTANEMSTYYAMADVQANGVCETDSAIATDDDGLAQFKYKDALNIKLAWVLDGVNPSEHIRGSLDTGSIGLNMERGFGGRFNAQDVSALFPMVPPGDHTVRLMALRAEMPDEVQAPEEKFVNIPLWTAIFWEIRR